MPLRHRRERVALTQFINKLFNLFTRPRPRPHSNIRPRLLPSLKIPLTHLAEQGRRRQTVHNTRECEFKYHNGIGAKGTSNAFYFTFWHLAHCTLLETAEVGQIPGIRLL